MVVVCRDSAVEKALACDEQVKQLLGSVLLGEPSCWAPSPPISTVGFCRLLHLADWLLLLTWALPSRLTALTALTALVAALAGARRSAPLSTHPLCCSVAAN